MTDTLEIGVTIVLVDVNQALAAATYARALLAFTYTILTLASMKAGARVKVGEGSEPLTTLVSTSASFASTDTIWTLVLKQG